MIRGAISPIQIDMYAWVHDRLWMVLSRSAINVPFTRDLAAMNISEFTQDAREGCRRDACSTSAIPATEARELAGRPLYLDGLGSACGGE